MGIGQNPAIGNDEATGSAAQLTLALPRQRVVWLGVHTKNLAILKRSTTQSLPTMVYSKSNLDLKIRGMHLKKLRFSDADQQSLLSVMAQNSAWLHAKEGMVDA